MTYQKQLKKDLKLAPLLKGEPYILKKRKNTAVRLIASILSQQLNTKVAKIIPKICDPRRAPHGIIFSCGLDIQRPIIAVSHTTIRLKTALIM